MHEIQYSTKSFEQKNRQLNRTDDFVDLVRVGLTYINNTDYKYSTVQISLRSFVL